MGYSEKIQENKRIVKKCRDISAFNVGASRAYYCAFISIKKYLVGKEYDYSQFLVNIEKTSEREFSHGTIKRALFECLMRNGNTLSNSSKLNVIDNLYRKRRIADYDDKCITNSQFEDSVRELEIIMNVIGEAK